MSENIHKIHDHFFKMAMKDLRVVREFFEMHLPVAIQDNIRWETLESHPTVQNSQLYREDITDIAFKVMLQEEMIFLHAIIDHQSTPDPMMAFRAENYRHNLIADYVSQHKEAQKIPLVLSFVLYHGTTPWKYDTDIRSLVDAPKHLVEEYAFRPFVLIDLNAIEDEILRQKLWAGAMQLVQKYIFEQDILPYLPAILEFLHYLKSAGGGTFAGLVLEYVVKGADVSADDFLNVVNTQLTSDIRGEIMTVAEQLIAKGVQQGMQQGMRQGMQQGLEQGIQQTAKNFLANGFDIETVSKNTGLDIDLLRKLKEEVRH